MSNSYFQFKQFTVQQSKAAMKVCTDACLFGAWVASEIENEKSGIENVLDIGAGTGLLSLMLAQKTSAQIDAVELHDLSAEQAAENFSLSPWRNQLHLHHKSVQQFSQIQSQLYDLIISNPPFFESSLQSAEESKNTAKHTNDLSYSTLIEIVFERLKEEGKFFLLLPYFEFKKFAIIAEKEMLFLHEQVHVKQTESHSYFRTFGSFAKQPGNTISSEIVIKTNNEYTAEFANLLSDYYLYL